MHFGHEPYLSLEFVPSIYSPEFALEPFPGSRFMEQSPWLHADEWYMRRYGLRPPPIPMLDVEQAFVVVDVGYDGDQEDFFECQGEVAKRTHVQLWPLDGLVEDVNQSNHGPNLLVCTPAPFPKGICWLREQRL